MLLPDYIDKDAWDGFADMRKTIKKPMTPRAAKLVLYELHRIKTAGHCPNASLDQSTMHCWADVYQPKEKPIEAAASSAADKTLAELDRRTSIPKTAPPPQVAQIAEHFRRRA